MSLRRWLDAVSCFVVATLASIRMIKRRCRVDWRDLGRYRVWESCTIAIRWVGRRSRHWVGGRGCVVRRRWRWQRPWDLQCRRLVWVLLAGSGMRRNRRSDGEESPQMCELLMPINPFFFRSVEVVLHVAQEFHFHDMNLSHRDAGNLCPSLIGVCVIIQKLVAQHQSHREQTIFTSKLALHTGVLFLQSVDKKKCEEYDVLCDLSCGQNSGDPFCKARRW